ncbi:hypothetical protein BDW59DRAFT_133830 [Aspergillus cavernicola]|uniref:Uncharacterized protein n=1 Tax=Aspergillus cavernicola TaxID=176166 RepID=A0ABR4HPE4_9EURO
MATKQPESSEHAARRRAVGKIEKSLLSIQADQYKPAELLDMSIQVLDMPLSEDGDPLFKSLYYRPFKGPLANPALNEKYPDYTVPEQRLRFYKEHTEYLKDEPDYGIQPKVWARDTQTYFRLYLKSLLYSDEENTPEYDEHRIFG